MRGRKKNTFEQPGVKAPGTPNNRTFLSLQKSAKLICDPGSPS